MERPGFDVIWPDNDIDCREKCFGGNVERLLRAKGVECKAGIVDTSFCILYLLIHRFVLYIYGYIILLATSQFTTKQNVETLCIDMKL